MECKSFILATRLLFCSILWIYILVNTSPNNFHENILKIKLKSIHTNFFLVGKTFVWRVVFPVVPKGWMLRVLTLPDVSGLGFGAAGVGVWGCCRRGSEGGERAVGQSRCPAALCSVNVSLAQNPSQWSMEFKIRFSRHPNWIRGIVLKICWLWNV